MVNFNWQKYPVYKSSGVEWLGDIPEHWEVKKIKRITQTHKQGYYTENPYIDEGVKLARITDIDDFGNVSFENMPFVEISEKNEKSFQLKKVDFLSARSGTIGRFGLVNALESSVFASYLIRFRFKNVEPEFLKFAFSSSFFKESLISTLHGGANNNVHAENIKEQILVIPPTSEQQAIANFLDEKTAQIDEYIAKKQRMIELLKEQKTVIINQAVTKGINPDVPMKDSGVEWLGEIPEHWEVKRLKYVSHIQTGVTLGKSYINQVLETRPYLRVANVQDGYIDISDIKTIELPNNEISRYVLQKGDVLMTEGGDFDKLGRGYIWKGQIKGCLHQNHIFAVRPIYKYLNSNFIAAFISSQKCKNYFIFTAKQTTNLASTNSTHLKNLKLLLPPLNEQQEIVSFIEKKSEKVERSLTAIEKEIKLIQEYRTTLISETVTGKIDVRKYHPPQ